LVVPRGIEHIHEIVLSQFLHPLGHLLNQILVDDLIRRVAVLAPGIDGNPIVHTQQTVNQLPQIRALVFAEAVEIRDALKILNKASSEVLSGNLKGAVPDIDLNVAIPLLAEASSVIIRRWKTGGSSILENLRTD